MLSRSMLEQDRGDEDERKEPSKRLDSWDNDPDGREENVNGPKEENDSQESKPGKESEDTKHVFFLSVVVSIRRIHLRSKGVKLAEWLPHPPDPAVDVINRPGIVLVYLGIDLLGVK